MEVIEHVTTISSDRTCGLGGTDAPMLNRVITLGLLGLLAWCPTLSGAGSPGVDDHTVALWLFDEPTYPNVILTDAGRHGYDLRLQSVFGEWAVRNEGKGEPPAEPLHVAGEYGLVSGKFGNALYVPDPSIARIIWPDNRQRYSSASMLGYVDQVPERFNLGYYDWTIECWFRAKGDQPVPAVLFQVHNEEDYPRGLSMENLLRLEPGRKGFTLVSHTTTASEAHTGEPATEFRVELTIPTDAVRLNDEKWHHLAFCFTANQRQLRHFIDGTLQPLPEKGGFLPMIGVLTSVTIGTDFRGLLDEYRISDVARYPHEFSSPTGFSRNYGPGPRTVNRPDGPPLLFEGNGASAVPVALGSRKHVLIDGALVDSLSNLEFRPQPPVSRQITDFSNSKPWEANPRFGSTIPDVSTVWDEGDELRMIYTNGGMWGGKSHVVCLAVSRDGLHWEKPELNLHAWNGELPTNIIIPNAGQGALIKDPNPAAADSERYKMLQWSYYRGYYLYTSPDGMRFQRNETVGFPFDTDGSTTFFWDDQRGLYHAYFRAVSEDRSIRRRTGHMEIYDLFQPWPFSPVKQPFLDDLVLAIPARGELPIIDTNGQVYRFKAHKYAWAPDTYLAFPWRYVGDTNIRPGSFLMVSRDGTRWTRYEDPYYFPGGWTLEGREVLEALTEHGLIRRGDQIWQYGTVRFTEHGGALYGGVEYDGGIHDRLLRLTQRLDGFVAVVPVDGSAGGGTLVTRPLIFEGDRLELNVDATGGSVRVELQDVDGIPIPGYTLEESVPLIGDGTAQSVAWQPGKGLAGLSSRSVRLKIVIEDARLFALQFR
jgi:hypothetical protein